MFYFLAGVAAGAVAAVASPRLFKFVSEKLAQFRARRGSGE